MYYYYKNLLKEIKSFIKIASVSHYHFNGDQSVEVPEELAVVANCDKGGPIPLAERERE